MRVRHADEILQMLNLRPFRNSSKALLGWLAVVALCVPPIPLVAGDCSCGDTSRAVENESCCVAAPVATSCCSTKTTCCETEEAALSPECGCSSADQGCECPSCGCTSSNDLPPVPPAIPSESNESQTQSLLVTLSIGWIDVPDVKYPVNAGQVIPASISRTAQQTCVILSRFTC